MESWSEKEAVEELVNRLQTFINGWRQFEVFSREARAGGSFTTSRPQRLHA